MTKERIEELAFYFYEKRNRKCPIRLSVTSGMAGFDLSRQAFVALMTLLANSMELDEELDTFCSNYSEEYNDV